MGREKKIKNFGKREMKCRVQNAECRVQNAELDKIVGADSISARFVGFLLIYGGVDFIIYIVGGDVLDAPFYIQFMITSRSWIMRNLR